MKNIFFIFMTIFLKEKSLLRFSLLSLIGFALSMAIILISIGIMDGFLISLKNGLNKSEGDIFIYHDTGFFHESEVIDKLKENNITNLRYSSYIQTEGFVVSSGETKGVEIRGIENNAFDMLDLKKYDLSGKQILIGNKLANMLKLEVGDELTIALAEGNKNLSMLPLLLNFRILGFFSNNIYEKELRTIYILKDSLQSILNVNDKINVISINSNSYSDSKIEKLITKISSFLPKEFNVKSYWDRYSVLLEAVKTEKFLIAFILQLIVIVACFNILAFVLFINESCSKPLFLFRALGFNQTNYFKLMLSILLAFWALASCISYGLVYLFSYILSNFSILNLPGDIYFLNEIDLILSYPDYIMVFSLSLLWLIIISIRSIYKFKKRPILAHLRKEFA